MKKTILAVIWLALVLSPCLLMLCLGNDDFTEILVCLVYSLILFKYHRVMIPKWVRDKVDNLVCEDRVSNLD